MFIYVHVSNGVVLLFGVYISVFFEGFMGTPEIVTYLDRLEKLFQEGTAFPASSVTITRGNSRGHATKNFSSRIKVMSRSMWEKNP